MTFSILCMLALASVCEARFLSEGSLPEWATASTQGLKDEFEIAFDQVDADHDGLLAREDINALMLANDRLQVENKAREQGKDPDRAWHKFNTPDEVLSRKEAAEDFIRQELDLGGIEEDAKLTKSDMLNLMDYYDFENGFSEEFAEEAEDEAERRAHVGGHLGKKKRKHKKHRGKKHKKHSAPKVPSLFADQRRHGGKQAREEESASMSLNEMVLGRPAANVSGVRALGVIPPSNSTAEPRVGVVHREVLEGNSTGMGGAHGVYGNDHMLTLERMSDGEVLAEESWLQKAKYLVSAETANHLLLSAGATLQKLKNSMPGHA